MSNVVSLEDKLLLEFNTPNFVDAEELTAQFKFRPDLLLKNENTVRAFIVRKSNGIPVEFIERYSERTQIEGFLVEKYIAFTSKPDDETIIKCINEKRVGICYLLKGTICTLLPVGGFDVQDNAPVAAAPYEMPHTVIFFSSVEELPERKRGKKIVELINAKYKKSVWANLIERDKLKKTMTPKELNNEIYNGIINDEYFLGILSEEFAGAVESEIQIAMQWKPYDNIILLVKDNDETRKAWNAILTDIEIRFHSRKKTVWYTKYDDIEDFEETVRKEIMELISKKHKENGASFL